MKRKVFITGISSELMIRFVSQMNPYEFEIIGLSRSQKSIPNVKVVDGDMLDISTYKDHLTGCDTIIHAAAITHSFSEKNYFEVNLEGTRKLVDAAVEIGVDNFVFVSSNTAGEFSGAYGLSKLRAEEYIKEHLTNWVVLRPAEIFGGTKKEGIEEFIENASKKSIVLCPKDVPTDFYPIHIDDAVAEMHRASFDADYLNSTSVIAGSKGYSFIEIIDLVKSVAQRNPRVVLIPKSIMFLIRRIASLLPFNLGVIPDQIDRLYAVKEIDARSGGSEQVSLESYVKKLIG